MLLEQGIIRIILYQFLLVVMCSLQDLTGILMVLTSTCVVDSVFFLLTIFGFRKMWRMVWMLNIVISRLYGKWKSSSFSTQLQIMLLYNSFLLHNYCPNFTLSKKFFFIFNSEVLSHLLKFTVRGYQLSLSVMLLSFKHVDIVHYF